MLIRGHAAHEELYNVARPLPGVLSRVQQAVIQTESFPRLRYMGSKYRLIPELVRIFAELGGCTALDAFSGSGVVSYALKALGFSVSSNDFLAFPRVIAQATVENNRSVLSEDEIDEVAGVPRDDRDLISRTFDGLYFTQEDR